jgi:bifunctional non-homologous end joining protein LigD
MRLLRIAEPFDHPEFVFEPKIDGFRALADIEGRRCVLVSRNGHEFKSWPQLADDIAGRVRCRSAVLDGESCLDADGHSNFYRLLFRRDLPYFYAFDLLALNGDDLRSLALLERKQQLRRIVPCADSRLLYVEYVEHRGVDLFRVACERDLDGIVGKWARGCYLSDGHSPSWIKIKNANYTQIAEWHELFERYPVRNGSSLTCPHVSIDGLPPRNSVPAAHGSAYGRHLGDAQSGAKMPHECRVFIA